jgi:hypothetical protein
VVLHNNGLTGIDQQNTYSRRLKMTKQKQIKGAVHHSPKTMSHNTELTLGQLTQISGGSTREERKEKREKRREEREHKKTCPDGKRTPDCPYPVPEMTASIDLN